MNAALPRRRSQPRGSALLVAVVIVAVLSLMVVAVVKLSGAESEAAMAKRRYDQLISCADAARQLLQSQFRTSGLVPTSLTLNRVVGDHRMASGHFDSIGITGAVTESSGAAQSEFGVSDMSNLIVSSSFGGTVYRVSVVCASENDPTRQAEVEYSVRFGL